MDTTRSVPGPGVTSRVPSTGEFEWRVLHLPRGVSRSELRQMLTDQAEYGHWELARVRLYMGGHRTVWLRRRIIRVMRTA
jgi:hypothetical protein